MLSLGLPQLRGYLPPQVRGEVTSYLDLTIEVSWKTIKKFNSVKIKLLWWGESEGIFCEINTRTSSPIRYQICTSHSLWLTYLKHAAPYPLRIEVYSSKTLSLIGTSNILWSFTSVLKDFAIVSDILTVRQFKLGEVSLRLSLYPVTVPVEMPVTKLHKADPALKSVNKENLQIIGKSKNLTARGHQTKVQTFPGHNPTARSRSAPLKSFNHEEIGEKSPTKTKTIANQTTLKEPLHKSCEWSGFRMIPELEGNASECFSANSINALQRKGLSSFMSLAILKVTFEPSEQQRMQQFMDKSPLKKFIFKCAVTSKSFADDYCLSPVFETVPHNVAFIRTMNQQISSKEDSKINFGLCIKTIDGATAPLFIGFSSLILKNSSGICELGIFHKKCLIMNEGGIVVGSILLKVGISHGKQDAKSFNRPSHSNDQCEPGKTYENKSLQTDGVSSHQVVEGTAANLRSTENIENRHTEKVAVEDKKPSALKIYSGLLFIEEIRNVKNEHTADYFITYEGFWNKCQERTEISVNGLFNYLKQFPLICDESFLEQVLNNHLELKLWEKTLCSEKLVGTTLIPLHQFFIAFRDAAMIDHLSRNSLPIISFDNWANFVTPLSNELFCQSKILLAVGSESQIDYLKLLRNLEKSKLPFQIADISAGDKGCSLETAAQPSTDQSRMKNKLSAFIDSLSQKLPENDLQNTSNLHKLFPTCSSNSEVQQPSQLGKTSDLLESLHKALLSPPTPSFQSVMQCTDSGQASDDSLSQEKVRTRVSIDHAIHLQKVTKKRQNRRKSKISPITQKIEFEPAAYATFESAIEQGNGAMMPGNIVKSHEGLVHCTRVLRGCEPHWNENFDVQLMLDVFTNPQKRFIVKIWRKVAYESEMTPAPFVDAVIGFCAIDLSVLMTGLPVLSGYYNIVDFSGKVNGQIKLSVTPQDALLQNQTSMFPENIPLNISMADENGPNLLSRTLKRKFNELDEITQRLKARLQDVTGDENFESEDEFERDLNTCAENDEICGISSCTQDFAWLNDSNGNVLGEQLLNGPSTSKAIYNTATSSNQRQVPGSSNSSLAIDQLLKKYDLDTIINPNIFKNIIDPSLANSDSTPTLNQRTSITEEASCGESGDTSLDHSTDLSNDQMQTTMLQMQTALQKTTLTDNSSEPSSRKDPDGENNISE